MTAPACWSEASSLLVSRSVLSEHQSDRRRPSRKDSQPMTRLAEVEAGRDHRSFPTPFLDRRRWGTRQIADRGGSELSPTATNKSLSESRSLSTGSATQSSFPGLRILRYLRISVELMTGIRR